MHPSQAGVGPGSTSVLDGNDVQLCAGVGAIARSRFDAADRAISEHPSSDPREQEVHLLHPGQTCCGHVGEPVQNMANFAQYNVQYNVLIGSFYSFTYILMVVA